MNELLYKSLFFKKDQRCCSLNGGDFVEEFQKWIGCAQMVIGDWQFTYAMKAKSGLLGVLLADSQDSMLGKAFAASNLKQ